MIALLMTFFSVAAFGQLYKCVGKDGRVEYASQCPPGTRQQATGIKSAPASASPAPAAPQKSLAEQDAEFRKRMAEKQEAEAKAAKKTADAAQRQRACDNARAYLKDLQAGNRAFKVDPVTGERAYLEDSQYASEIAAAQKSIETNCN